MGGCPLAEPSQQAGLNLQQALNALNKREVWIDQILGVIREGIVTLDDRGCVTFFSRRAELITGWDQADVLGRHCDEIFVPVEGDKRFSQMLPPHGEERRLSLRAEDQRRISLSIIRIHLQLPDENTGQTVLILQRESEEGGVDHLLSHFLADITHEFRTPLAALAASIELLLDQASVLTLDELQELLTSLHLGILGLQTLVDNLLEAASLESGQFRVSPRPAQLNEILGDAVRLMRPLVEKYNQRLVVEAPAEAPAVRADPRRTVQVLVNLLSNAAKHGAEGSEIIIGAIVEDGWVRVTVADRGPGIPAEYLDNLFDRFVHFDSGQGQGQHGTGLGLWIVDAVVTAHGGQVGVEDRPGGGSIFWFTLPRLEEP